MMTLTKFGVREWGSAIVVAVLLWGGCYALIRYGHPAYGWSFAAVVAVVLFAFCAFFRNPSRTIPADPQLIVSPADGVVRDITVLDDFEFFPAGTKTVRIGIFLSVFNVHVNRTPVAMQVSRVHYRKGEYLDARNPEAGKRNEAMTIIGCRSNQQDFPVAVRQISGAIARRIVCPVSEGQLFAKGDVYGMIKFGSRTELYLPADKVKVNVKVGDAVRGGETIMAEILEAVSAESKK